MFPFLSTLLLADIFPKGLTPTGSVVDSWVWEPQGRLCADGAGGGDRKAPPAGGQLLSDSAKSRRGGRSSPTSQS